MDHQGPAAIGNGGLKGEGGRVGAGCVELSNGRTGGRVGGVAIGLDTARVVGRIGRDRVGGTVVVVGLQDNPQIVLGAASRCEQRRVGVGAVAVVGGALGRLDRRIFRSGDPVAVVRGLDTARSLDRDGRAFGTIRLAPGRFDADGGQVV